MIPSASLVRRGAQLSLSLLFLAAPALRADVVIRYKTDVKLAPFLPPAAIEQFDKAKKSPQPQSMGMKGNKGYSEEGGVRRVVDFVKQEMTVIDAGHKRYATIPVSQFGEKMMPKIPEMPEDARKMFSAMKTSFDSRKTGRTEVIQGVQAEEREVLFSLSMPVSGSEGESVPTMKMVMQIWTAQPGEALRVQAIRELTAYNLWTTHFLNPAEALQKAFGAFPVFEKGFATMLAEMNAVMLRMHVAVYSPMMARMQPADFDPNAPMVEMTQEVAELSTASLDEAMFGVPEEYKSCSVEEVMQSILPVKEPMAGKQAQ